MRYKLLGRSGLRVSELALGTMTFGEDWGWGADRGESGRIVAAFAEAGGNFVDTANNYTDGSAERFVGELLADDRDYWVVSTKYTLSTDPRDPNSGGNHRKSLVQSLDRSLERLRTDRIDLFWVHIWDFTTPVEEVMRTLDDQVRAGKVLYVGLSDAPAWVVAEANTLATLRGWTPFVALQLQYNLVERGIERELLPYALHSDLAITAWGPLASGLLTGKYRRDARPAAGDGRLAHFDAQADERRFDVVDAVGQVAKELGATPAQVALAWLRHRPGVVIPIVGARRLDQLEDNLRATDLHLGADQLAVLDQASAVPLGFPYDFVNSPPAADLPFGEIGDRLDDHRRDRSGRAVGA